MQGIGAWVAASAIWDGRTPPQPGAKQDAPWQRLCPYCEAELERNQVFRPGHCDSETCRDRHMRLLNFLAEEGRRAAYHADCDGEDARRAAEALAAEEGCSGDDVVSVIVPYQNAPLEPLPDARREAFLSHLGEAVAEAFARDPEDIPELEAEDADPLTIAGCSTCQGYCCRQGADRFAFLTAGELAAIRTRRPELDGEGLLAFYTAALPDVSVEGACVFQGAQGCVLSRDVRSSVCNSFHCRELIEAFSRVADAPDAPVVVLARADDGVQATGALVDGEWRLR